MDYEITTTDGRYLNTTAFESFDEALIAIAVAMGWPQPVVSGDFTVDETHAAVCVYESQEDCDADAEGAYAPRITAPSGTPLY